MPRQLFTTLFGLIACWTFYAALVFAPWYYGTTTPEGIVKLNWILSISLSCWLVELLCTKRAPRLSWRLVVGSVAILICGWWMVVNAVSFRDWQYETFVPRRQLISGTGSVDYALSAAFMLRVTLILGSVWFVADSMRRPKFVLKLWWAIVIAGTSISLLGLLQKATGAQMIFWEQPNGPEPPATTFFATYFYHANAGAFLNLTWPFAGGLALRSVQRNSHPLVRATLASFFVIDLVAVMANTSRMSQLVAALMLLGLLLVFASQLWKGAQHLRWQISGSAIALILLVLLAIAYASQSERALERWQITTTSDAFGAGGRLDAAKVGWTAAKAAGWFGFGPGTFRAVFPRFQAPTNLEGTWIFLHQDYLQTIIEWGWLGAVMWAVVFFGGMVNGVMELWSNGRRMLPRYRMVARLAIVALTGVGLHALVDFPLQIASVQLYAAVALGIAWNRPLEFQRSV